MSQKTIIFDFNGTIADTSKIAFNAINKMSEKYNYKKLTFKEANSLRDKGMMEIIKMYNVPLYKIPFILKDVRKEMEGNIKEAKIYEGIKELIIKLKKEKLFLAIVSSDSEDNIRSFLKDNKINIFDKII